MLDRIVPPANPFSYWRGQLADYLYIYKYKFKYIIISKRKSDQTKMTEQIKINRIDKVLKSVDPVTHPPQSLATHEEKWSTTR